MILNVLVVVVVMVLWWCTFDGSLCFRLLKWKLRSSISPLSSLGPSNGALVGGAIISIFGFCSSNRQWSRHWSTTISSSSESGHSRLGHGDHQTWRRNDQIGNSEDLSSISFCILNLTSTLPVTGCFITYAFGTVPGISCCGININEWWKTAFSNRLMITTGLYLPNLSTKKPECAREIRMECGEDSAIDSSINERKHGKTEEKKKQLEWNHVRKLLI